MALFLAFKEVWRNRGRFILFSMVIALVTTLVLFVGSLAAGLSLANREYFDKLDADLIVLQSDVDLQITASRLPVSILRRIDRLDVVENAGALGISNTKLENGAMPLLDVSLLGVEAGKPGSPDVISGRAIRLNRRYETVIDENVASRSGLGVGDTLVIRSTQGTDDELYDLRIVGITESREFLYQPAVFVPLQIWDKVRPQASINTSAVAEIANAAVVQLVPGIDREQAAAIIDSSLSDIETANITQVVEAIPGYSVQQSTLGINKGFTFLIGVLVIGGFFQIQTLQKVPLIGVLKAIGTSTPAVSQSVILQIIFITVFGVFLGTSATLGLGALLPDGVPAVFSLSAVWSEILIMLVIGPLGGLVAVRMASRVEPLKALGLS
ncbi:MAG: ABC transporter permease [Anaerolineaceae bacterium]|nr:ABC transporter permease [Anaerolineaceae bacterium]